MDKYTLFFLHSVEPERTRTAYANSISQIRDKVEEIWANPQHRHFTDHTITHSERVLRYLWPLTRPCSPKLSDSEIYILVAAAYLHDIGMQSEETGTDVGENRRIHERLSVEMIETLELGILPPYKDDLGLVVRAHRHVHLDTAEYDATTLNDDSVRPRLLGSLLRLADELELTYERVRLSRQKYQRIGLEALAHWYRHEYIRSVDVDEVTKRIRIRYRFPTGQREECEYAIADYVQGVIGDTLREIESYVWDDQAVFRLEPPDTRESQNAETLPADVLRELRLGVDKRIGRLAESNSRSASITTDDNVVASKSRDDGTHPSSHVGTSRVQLQPSPLIDQEHGNAYQYNSPRRVDPDTFAKAQRIFDALPLESIPSPARSLEAGSRMPLQSNHLFVNREGDLRALAATLKVGNAAAIITGLGGTGKTQLAVEFAHRYGPFFAGGVFWLTFTDPAGIAAQVAACGHNLDLHPDFATLAPDNQKRLVLDAWLSVLPRLLIFDNCNEEELLARWHPPTGNCRVLVTSHRDHWNATLRVTPSPLRELPRDESVALLRKYRDGAMPDDALGQIAKELGDLPLALHLAGSFLQRYRHDITPAAYLDELRSPALLLHPSLQGIAAYLDELRSPALLLHPSLQGIEVSPTNHEHVARTFALSYEKLDAVDATDAHARALLARAAYFALGEPIPRDLLFRTLTDANPSLQARSAALRLGELGLLATEATGDLRLHRLLAAFIRNVTSDADDVEARESVERILLEEANRLNKRGYPSPMLPIQPHLRALADMALQQQRTDEQALDLCAELGYHLYILGDYKRAQPYFERALDICERAPGPDHPDTAGNLSNLARVLHARGDYTAARELYQRALTIRERVPGPDHPDTARSLNNLALLLADQGDYANARSYHQRALAIRKQELRPDHPDIAESMSNLASSLFADQGDYAAAESLHRRALAIRERELGPDHPDTAQSLSNLGALLLLADWPNDAAARKAKVEAQDLFERALAIRERTLGSHHPATAASLHDLGRLWQSRGEYGTARQFYERALAIREQALGPTHPDTVQISSSLAALPPEKGETAGGTPL